MSFSNVAETAILKVILDGTNLPWDANTNLWMALHTADPTESGTAVSFEAAYGSYARIPITRATGFNIAGNQASNANQVQFPQSTVAGADVTYASIVDTASGAGNIILRAQLNDPIPTSVGIQPLFDPNGLTFQLD
jgi:hypothetical protein